LFFPDGEIAALVILLSVAGEGIDLFKFDKRLLLSLEPDLKRAPCNPRMIDVASRERAHLGYPTKVSEPRSAKSQKVVLGCVPRTEDVMVLFERLQAEFPGAELGRLLAGVESVGR
jgi:hypothetical protein